MLSTDEREALLTGTTGAAGPDAVGPGDHRLVAAAYCGRQFFGRKNRQDRKCNAAPDTLDTGQLAERLALAGRAEPEQGPAILAHLQFGQDQHIAADWAQRI